MAVLEPPVREVETIAVPVIDVDIDTGRETKSGSGSEHRHCDGCPRCQDAGAPFCPSQHPEHDNLHPVCRRCGHCVLRGKHGDDTSDLDQKQQPTPRFGFF